MPSDPRIQASLDALQRQISAYLSVVVAARERIRTMLGTGNGVNRTQLALGMFGGAHIDVTRFAEMEAGRGATLDVRSRDVLSAAAMVLDEILAAANASFVVDVTPGGSLTNETTEALAKLGRAFGAAQIVELVRSGRYDPAHHGRFLTRYPFEWWNANERAHAPPLVISVDGAALRVGGLADLLDGEMKVVLVARGASSPAPLIRLVTPAAFVAQTTNVLDVSRLAAHKGPAVAALVDETAACFAHDPALGRALWQRLSITRVPQAPTRKSIGGVSPRQQQDEIAQLDALAQMPALPGAPLDAVVGAGAGDPVSRLTQWLLAESELAT